VSTKQIYDFGVFRIDAEERRLLRDGNPVPLTPKAFETLLILVENSGHVVKKDDLMKRVWPDSFVEEVNLAQNISAVRRVLDTNGEQYIETVSKIGYRLKVKARFVNEPVHDNELPSVVRMPAASTAQVESPASVPRGRASVRRAGLISLAAIVTVTVFLLALRFAVRSPSGVVSAHITSIAVLPLENLSKDPEQEYFADGMTDALITDLAKIHALRVISRTSVMPYKGKRKSLPEFARELNVDAVVEGTVWRSGDRVRITAQLIEAPADHHLWAETYERDLRDVLSMQDDVARAIAGEIKITLTPPERNQLSNARPVDPSAHEAYLRGMYELHGMTAEPTELLQSQSIQKAIGYFEVAAKRDPSDAMAFAGLADAYASLSTFYKAPLEVMPKAKVAARRAIELDDNLAEAHASLGYVALTFDWDWVSAEREFRKAIELNPSLPRAHAGYAQYLLFIAHRPEQSMQEMQQAYALDPLLPQAHGDMAWFLFLARRYPESIQAAQKVGHDDHIKALSFAELGRSTEAIAAADSVVQTTRSPIIQSQLAAAYAVAGKKDKARAMISGIEAQAHKRYVCGFNVACLYAVLGDKERAFSWLEKAYRDRSD
jgi:TolB-like protein/DNA-binding winged helix-turn-helix (wHTH) protein/Flp pilus assembly protein TadD